MNGCGTKAEAQGLSRSSFNQGYVLRLVALQGPHLLRIASYEPAGSPARFFCVVVSTRSSY